MRQEKKISKQFGILLDLSNRNVSKKRTIVSSSKRLLRKSSNIKNIKIVAKFMVTCSQN